MTKKTHGVKRARLKTLLLSGGNQCLPRAIPSNTEEMLLWRDVFRQAVAGISLIMNTHAAVSSSGRKAFSATLAALASGLVLYYWSPSLASSSVILSHLRLTCGLAAVADASFGSLRRLGFVAPMIPRVPFPSFRRELYSRHFCSFRGSQAGSRLNARPSGGNGDGSREKKRDERLQQDFLRSQRHSSYFDDVSARSTGNSISSHYRSSQNSAHPSSSCCGSLRPLLPSDPTTVPDHAGSLPPSLSAIPRVEYVFEEASEGAYGNRPRSREAKQSTSHACISASESERKVGGKNVKQRPIYIYTDEVEPGALRQLRELARQPFVVGHVAAMPDVHLGKGATIGSVFASSSFICPNAVGVDIGCGMCAVPVEGLSLRNLKDNDLVAIQQKLKRRIPTGRDFHDTVSVAGSAPRSIDEMVAKLGRSIAEETKLLQPFAGKVEFKSNGSSHSARPGQPSSWLRANLAQRHLLQLGSLGGGNHFIELLYDECDRIWLMLHSGSRHMGKFTAEHYDKLAVRHWAGRGLYGREGLASLPIESEEGQGYLRDMTFCMSYARENRRLMMEAFSSIVREVTGKRIVVDEMVNIHHNYCQWEECIYQPTGVDGRQESEEGSAETEWIKGPLWVTRKGATSARKGQLGIVPGSMGTGSFITRGLGNPFSWQSCSHGAGRRMSRTAAKKDISQSEFEKVMAGITCDTAAAVRDEAPQAYKNLDDVMKYQRDLVEVVHRLYPLLNVKGFD